MPRRKRKRTWLSIVVLAAATVPLSARAADLLRDDFDGPSLNSTNWSIGTWQLGRTQLGFTPQVTGGNARLRHDTYNPSNPGVTFKGSEILSNQTFTRGSGLEYEARVRVNPLPGGLVTSFFTYNTVNGTPPLADEIDFEFLSKEINASSPTVDPVLATTWNNYKTNGSNFGDPDVHSSVDVNVPGLDLSQFNTVKIRWLPDRVQWYVNGAPIRTSLYAVPDLPAPIRANFWAPGTEWPDAYSSSFQPTANPAANASYLYDIDYIAVRRIFSPVAASGAGRVFTDNFSNGNVANSDTINGFWTQRNQGSGGGVTSGVTETSVTPANSAEPLKLTAAGAGFPHAQIVSSVRSEFNLFRNPVALEATGIGFSSTSNSTIVNTIGKSILRFVLSSQTLSSGSESEYTSADALALRIEGGNVVALGYKVNAPNANTEYSNNLLSQTMSGPVRRVYLVAHGSFYSLQVDHDLSNTDSTQVTNEFTGALSLNLADWNASGDASMYIQGQLNTSGANENMTALVGSLAVSAVRPTWNVDGNGNWSSVANWTDKLVPNFKGATAKFSSAITANHTVTTDVAVTAGTLSFDNGAGYTIAGPGPITLNTYVDNARVEVLSGSHTIATPIVLARDTTIDVAAGAGISLTGDFAGGSFALTKTGAGNAAVKHVRAGSLNVSAGKLIVLQNGGAGGVSSIGALSVAAGAKLDLTDNKLIAHAATVGSWNGSAYTGVTGLIQSGQNGGAWEGSGIITSMPDALTSRTTLAIATADQTGYAGSTFGGISVVSGDVLIMYTYAGDANLDGVIDPDDYANISFNDNIAGANGYYNGDFNYDGDINADDFALIDFNFNAQGAPFPTSATSLNAVPEPSACAWTIVAAALLARRRNRR